MQDYTIVRVGNQYVVRTAEQGVLRIANRRMALRVIAEASRLLTLPCLPEVSREPGKTASITGDHAEAS